MDPAVYHLLFRRLEAQGPWKFNLRTAEPSVGAVIQCSHTDFKGFSYLIPGRKSRALVAWGKNITPPHGPFTLTSGDGSGPKVEEKTLDRKGYSRYIPASSLGQKGFVFPLSTNQAKKGILWRAGFFSPFILAVWIGRAKGNLEGEGTPIRRMPETLGIGEGECRDLDGCAFFGNCPKQGGLR